MVHSCFHTVAELVLASASPRRQRFLHELGLDFVVQPADVDETLKPGELPAVFVRRLAEEKARAVAETRPGAWVLAADTIVEVEGEILGKPSDAADAVRLLKLLRNRWHAVWTGFCLMRGKAVMTGVVRSEVRFGDFPDAVCAAYVATGEPLDKAGAYGIQGKGAFLVREIKGSYSNVVGLPLHEVVDALMAQGIIEPRS
ncbi:MAG: Maf family protein [Thermodesulfobacteriota bacterium]